MKRLAALIILSIVFLALVNWIRQDQYTNSIVTTLPFLGGYNPSIFDWAGGIICCIALLGLAKLARRNR